MSRSRSGVSRDSGDRGSGPCVLGYKRANQFANILTGCLSLSHVTSYDLVGGETVDSRLLISYCHDPTSFKGLD